ncbi:MAG: undecaprenyl/decaprenyl-phosphate alpha-N-acetylglucosaminyl 1-phosphate transferase [Candidatus Terrybacteria bacterium]|nr:undecaprenyl/decaprenyl-phosphate alpha-N-acetylglucosaminyl 1-phosphate transferase [Candidatus Terrybacteria bacterium]
MGEVIGSALAAFAIAITATPLVRSLARSYGIIRPPGGRHEHSGPTPLWGGLSILSTVLLVVGFHPTLVLTPEILALLIGLGLFLLVGMRDDRRELSWRTLLSLQGIAALILLLGGVRLWYISVFTESAWRLDTWMFSVPFPFCGTPDCAVPVLGSLLLIAWVAACVNAMNWLDGSDGVATTVSAVALAALAILSLTAEVRQPALAIIAAAGFGASIGFLPWNLPRARIFLGSAGSFGLGFLIAALAVLAGTKLATVAMVLLLPGADAAAVIFIRMLRGTPITQGDTRHLHHQLRTLGWKPREIIFLHGGTSALLGISAFLLPRPWKIVTLVLIFILFMGILVAMKVILSPERREKKSPEQIPLRNTASDGTI